MVSDDFEKKYLGKSLDLYIKSIKSKVYKINHLIILRLFLCILSVVFFLLIPILFVISGIFGNIYIGNFYLDVSLSMQAVYCIFIILFGSPLIFMCFVSHINKIIDSKVLPIILNFFYNLTFIKDCTKAKNALRNLKLCDIPYIIADFSFRYSLIINDVDAEIYLIRLLNFSDGNRSISITPVFTGILYVFNDIKFPYVINRDIDNDSIHFYSSKYDKENQRLYVLAESELKFETIMFLTQNALKKYSINSIRTFKQMIDYAKNLQVKSD